VMIHRLADPERGDVQWKETVLARRPTDTNRFSFHLSVQLMHIRIIPINLQVTWTSSLQNGNLSIMNCFEPTVLHTVSSRTYCITSLQSKSCIMSMSHTSMILIHDVGLCSKFRLYHIRDSIMLIRGLQANLVLHVFTEQCVYPRLAWLSISPASFLLA
jgi:hypothetical protein